MKVDRNQLFGGPKLTEGQTSAYINENIDLEKEGFLTDGIDGVKMTPMAAEYLYVLTSSHGEVVQATIKLKSKNSKNSKNDTMTKLGKGFASFMKGMQGMSKMAQQYDKASTKATQNAWGTNQSPSPRNRASSNKSKRRKTRKRKKR